MLTTAVSVSAITHYTVSEGYKLNKKKYLKYLKGPYDSEYNRKFSSTKLNETCCNKYVRI
jgi:hypothetical protein